jgi:hypothetical protein
MMIPVAVSAACADEQGVRMNELEFMMPHVNASPQCGRHESAQIAEKSNRKLAP